jgi:hypothetical protein
MGENNKRDVPSRGSKAGKFETIDRIIQADLFSNVVSCKIAGMDEFTAAEKDSVRMVARMVDSLSSSWKSSGRKPVGKSANRDAYYLREYRAKLALDPAREVGASKSLIDTLSREYEEAKAEYDQFKATKTNKPVSS